MQNFANTWLVRDRWLRHVFCGMSFGYFHFLYEGATLALLQSE